MFSRASCYFFVRPKRAFLEVCLFLDRGLKSPLVRRADRTSKTKVANILHVRHRDEVEAPITEWLREAYELQDVISARPKASAPAKSPRKSTKAPTKAPTKSTNRAVKQKASKAKPKARAVKRKKATRRS
jgi:hypothetical protein